MAERQPEKLCECGCGEPAPIASKTDSSTNRVEGQPMRFVTGHNTRVRQPRPPRLQGEGCNPGGLCECGCGEKTPLARYSCTRDGYIKGTPVRFVPGHQTRLPRHTGPEYVVDDNGCWIWQLHRDPRGYGRMLRDGEPLAHRWYYARAMGPIPPGHHLHHLCETPACVNPTHLQPLTPSDHRRLHVQQEAATQ